MLFIHSWALPRVTEQIKFRLHQIPARKETAELGLLLWQEVPDPARTHPLTVGAKGKAATAAAE